MKALFDKILKLLEADTKEELIITAKRIKDLQETAKNDINFSDDDQDIAGLRFAEALVKIVRG